VADVLKRPLVEDETITAVLSAEGGDERAAALTCLRFLLAIFARQADTGTRSADLYTNQRFERLKHVEGALLQELAIAGGTSALGLYVSAREAVLADTDRPVPAFQLGMLDFKE
jgi:hypothetical protein